MKNKVYIICGPTASGKTAVAIELAKLLNSEIISADSMQIYKDISIGTARPSEEEMQGIFHHLMGHISPDSNYSAAAFKDDASILIEEMVKKKMTPIIVGGTGLYINAITYDLDFNGPQADEKLRRELINRYDEDRDKLYSELIKLDPESEKRIHINNKVRVTRRMEILLSVGDSQYDFYRANEKYDFVISALSPKRSILYENINARVDEMIKNGLEDEVLMLYNQYGPKIQAFAAIGYKEFLPYFRKECSLEEVIDKIKLNTRHYAKRQLTWFKRDKRIKWYDPQMYPSAKELALEILKDNEVNDG